MKRLNVAIVGSGMYVCGKGTGGYGTVMPAVYLRKKKGVVKEIHVASTCPESVSAAREKIKGLEGNTGIKADVRFFPEKGPKEPQCYKEMINRISKPACAIISVPDHLHTEIARYSIDKGLHTLVVKPLAPTMEEVERLIRSQKAKKVYCAVEFHKRFDKANLMLRDILKSGRLGDALYFLVEYSQRKNVPLEKFSKWIKHTNIFQYLGIHYLDLIYFVSGARPVRAMATGQKNWLLARGIDTYDSIEAMIEWETSGGNRFSSCILTNWIDPEKTSAMSDQKIKVIGTKGRFESDQKRRGITVVTDEKGIEEPNPYFCASYGEKGSVTYSGYGIESICRFLDDVRDIEDGKITAGELEGKRPTFRDAILPTAALEAVNQSLASGGEWVEIDKLSLRVPTKSGRSNPRKEIASLPSAPRNDRSSWFHE